MSDISNIQERNCDSCGKPLPDGELFYHCRTEIIAGKDSTIPNLKNPDKLIAQAIAEISGKDEIELLNDVYQEFIMQLCPDCRIVLIKHIQSMFGSGCRNCSKCGTVPVRKKGKLLKFPPKKEK